MKALVLIGSSVALLGSNLLFLVASCLRETPEFWTNAGGYSVLLRDCLRLGYYPALGLLVLMHTALAFTFRTRVAWSLNALSAGPLALGLVVAWSNNLLNLWESRPLHWHP